MTSRSIPDRVRAGSEVGGAIGDRRANVRDLVALANAGALPQGHTTMGVAKMLAKKTAERSGVGFVELSTPSIDLFAVEAPAEKSEGDALPAVPTWIELIPAPLPDADEGHVETRDWRAGFKVDAQQIVDAFNAKPAHRRASPIDWEHKGHRNWMSERNPAAAWIEELRVGEDGKCVEGRVDWTPEGRDDVGKKRYRYISPVVAIKWPADSEGNIDWDAVPEADELIDAALTNNPATYIRDLAMTPVGESDESESTNSAEAGSLAASIAPAPQSKGGRPEDNDMKLSKEALSALGLGDDATQEQVEQALLALSSKPKPEPQKSQPEKAATFTADDMQAAVKSALAEFSAAVVDPLKKQVEELSSQDKESATKMLETQVHSAIDASVASFRATPAMRSSLAEIGMAIGIEKFRAHLDTLPSLASLNQPAGNGEIGKKPDVIELTPDERRLCKQIGLTAEEFLAQRKAEAEANKDKDAA